MPSSTPGPVIVASSTDQASFNIAQNLIQHYQFKKVEDSHGPKLYQAPNITLAIVEKDGIYVEPEDIPFKANSIIFVSKHRSNTGTPALTVHATGNLTKEALYGGKPEEVSFVEPFRIQMALAGLAKGASEAKVPIEVTMEQTHHGPTSFPVPVCFVEIGSGPSQWQDPSLGQIAAGAALAAAEATEAKGINVVGFGGTHYPAKHTRICLRGDYLVGHVVSKYTLEAEPSDNFIHDTFKKTLGPCNTALVDWKGLQGERRRRLLDKLAGWDVETVRC